MLEEQTRTEALRQQVAEQEQACASLKAQLNSTEERAKSSCEQLRSEMNHISQAQQQALAVLGQEVSGAGLEEVARNAAAEVQRARDQKRQADAELASLRERLAAAEEESKRAQDRQHERLCSVLAYLQSRDSAAGSPAEAASQVG